MKCRYCERDILHPCQSTRDMEERDAPDCLIALIDLGGGERVENQKLAESLKDMPRWARNAAIRSLERQKHE